MSESKQTLTALFEKTEWIDPNREKIVHELNAAVSTFNATTKGSDEEEFAKEIVEREEAKLEAFNANQAERVESLVEIGFVQVDRLTEFDAMEQAALGYDRRDKERAKLFVELDREVVKAGVKNHSNVFFHGFEIPFEANEDGSPTDQVLDFYARMRWLRPLRFAIMRFNTIEAEKKRN